MTAPSLGEITYGVFGAWRLARADKSGLAYFGDTADAFWKSFFAAVLVAPAYAILVAIHLSSRTITSTWVEVLALEGLAYVIVWAAFPLAAHYVTQALDRAEHFIRFIVAYNWSQVIQMAVHLPVALLIAAGLVPPGLAGGLDLVVFMVLMLYRWYIARVALDVSGGMAALLIFLDLVISFLTISLANAAVST